MGKCAYGCDIVNCLHLQTFRHAILGLFMTPAIEISAPGKKQLISCSGNHSN